MLSGTGSGTGAGVPGSGTSRQGGARLAAEPPTVAAADPRPAPDANRPSRPDATTSPQASAAERGRTGATRERARADDAADRRDEAGAPRFSDLLATPPADAAPPAADAGPEPADSGRDASAPERLLALLSGQWQPAIAPHAPDAGALAAATGGLPSATLAAGGAGAALAATALASTALASTAGPGGEPPVATSAVSTAASTTVAAGALPTGISALPDAPPLPATDAATAAPILTAATAAAANTSEPARAATAMAVAPEHIQALAGDAAAAGGQAAAIDGVAPLHGSPGTVAPAFRAESPLAQQPLALPANPEAGFDDGFGTHVAWMAGQRIGHAEIRINPEHAGPIDVHVELDGDRVHAGFHSASADVRQALEASLPRLRELLGQHGLQLGQAEVGQRQAGPDRDPARGGATPRDGAMAADAGEAPARPVAARLRGLVDAYA